MSDGSCDPNKKSGMDKKQKTARKPAPIDLQDAFLLTAIEANLAVSVYLVNGIHMAGQLLSMDKYSILLSNRRNAGAPQMILKGAISTISPEQPARRAD